MNLFTVGLDEPMYSNVEMQRTTDLQATMSLARAFERRAEAAATVSSLLVTRSTPRPRPFAAASTTSTQASAANLQATPTATPKCSRFHRLLPDEMADKRKKGKCYFYPEIFSLGHKCAMVCF
jgi:hypothetical protein